MANVERSTIIDYCVSCLVDVRSVTLDIWLFYCISLVTFCWKISGVQKIVKFNEAEGASKEGKLSFEKVQRSTIDFDEQWTIREAENARRRFWKKIIGIVVSAHIGIQRKHLSASCVTSAREPLRGNPA